MAKDNISRKGKNRASKFNEAHRLTSLKEGDYVLVKAINKSDPKRKILMKFLQIYEGPYEIKKQVRPRIQRRKRDIPHSRFKNL